MIDDTIFQAVKPFVATEETSFPAEGVLIHIVTFEDGRSFDYGMYASHAGEDPALLQRRRDPARGEAWAKAYAALITDSSLPEGEA